ncbi:hypothetical protein H4F69_16545 [Pectobacterium brasiliense]|uniref:hypothetical protein n=1 Tax=Pectobacterium brasiliense TaxID=180957 RepID=UPI0019695B7C|nr:hypothetical protein [Pectobacterium brasiliense]MBN3175157.1 hypothetical protein [Pectobacterium brasiliense]
MATSSITGFQHPEGLGRAKMEGDDSTPAAVIEKERKKERERRDKKKKNGGSGHTQCARKRTAINGKFR